MASDEEYHDEALDSAEGQQEYQDAMLDSIDASYPMQKKELGLFQLFMDVIHLKDSTKVAFLGKSEVGDLGVSVRDYQYLAKLSKLFKHDNLSTWLLGNAEIINATSMGRDGNLSELFVSQKKFSTRARKSSQLTQKKWSMFNKKEEPAQVAQ